jgi:hypothetical protein
MGQPGQWRGTVLSALVAAAIVGCFAAWSAWNENRHRTVPMDIDGWGVVVQRLKAPGAGASTLFSEPSLWKGPVVPFVFGLCYYLAPSDEAVLVFNVIAWGLAAGCFVIGFCSFGVDRISALLAVLLGLCYWPHHFIFGYYYAEPFLTLLLSLLLLLLRWTLASQRKIAALLTGGAASLLLLARPPFLIPVCGTAILLWLHTAKREKSVHKALWYLVGLAIVFLPWPIRNFLTYHEFIPFTTEGGKILFQGSYLPGDSATMDELRQIPEFAKLEKAEGQDAIQQYRYWRSLAIEQIRANPLGQLRLGVRKAIRFWTYLPMNSWTPGLKTALLASVTLFFAAAGAILGRRLFVYQFCVLWVGGLWLLHAIVHAELRYNSPVLTLTFLLAILGFRQLCLRPFLARAPKSWFPAGLAAVGGSSALSREDTLQPHHV